MGAREYEDRAEAVALRRLLPAAGSLLLEVGAGAGRNTPRYAGFQRVVLLDYSRTQLEQAQARLGSSSRYIYVAADVYRLPFVQGLFDAATMIRVLHHMVEPARALGQVWSVLRSGATFILEFANKRNLKSVLRYWTGRQKWNPFSLEPVEFASLNYDFHPRQVREWCEQLGFRLDRTLTVSHFRSQGLKQNTAGRPTDGHGCAAAAHGKPVATESQRVLSSHRGSCCPPRGRQRCPSARAISLPGVRALAPRSRFREPDLP